MTSPQEDGGEGGGGGQFEEAHAGSDHLILVDGLRKAWSHGTGPQTGLVKSLGKSGKKQVVQVWSVAQFRDVFLPSIFKPVASFNHAFFDNTGNWMFRSLEQNVKFPARRYKILHTFVPPCSPIFGLNLGENV